MKFRCLFLTVADYVHAICVSQKTSYTCVHCGCYAHCVASSNSVGLGTRLSVGIPGLPHGGPALYVLSDNYGGINIGKNISLHL